MLGANANSPFPELASTSLTSSEHATAEVLLPGRATWKRFGETHAYRDVTFAAIFLLQLLAVVIIAIANGISVVRTGGIAPAGDLPAGGVRSRRMISVLFTASFVASGLAAAWLLLLRSGARVLIWAGAGGSTVLALANGIWLLAQGGAAGYTLGILSLLAGAGCVLFLVLNRTRVEFSAHLLSTVATLTRAYPGMVWVAIGGAVVLLLWMLVWSAALSYTANMPNQGSVVFLLVVSLIWTTQLLKAVVNATVAGTVASWYFLSPNVPHNPTSRALKRALTTSFGSLCLGSLVAASLKSLRALAHATSSRSSGSVKSCALCCLGFLDVLTRFFNELAYTQVAMYGKTFTRASRDTWTLLVHHSGVDAIVQKELISTALALSALLAGLVCSLICGVWAKASLGPDQPHWWEAIVAAFVIGFGSVSLVSVTVESGVMALFVCYAEDPSPLSNISSDLYALFIQHPHVTSSAKDEPLEDTYHQHHDHSASPYDSTLPSPAPLPPPPREEEYSLSTMPPPRPSEAVKDGDGAAIKPVAPPVDSMADALGI